MPQITVQPSKLYVMQDVNWPSGGFTDGNTDLLPLSGERSIATFQDYDSVSDVYYDVHFNILAEYAPSLPANITVTGVTLNILTGNSHVSGTTNFTFYPTVFSTPIVPGTIDANAFTPAGSQLGQTSFTAVSGALNRWVAISCLGLKDNGWRFRFNSSGGSDLYFEYGSGAGKHPYLVIDYVFNNAAPNAPDSLAWNGTYWNNGSTMRASWRYTDPDGNNSSAFQVDYYLNGSYYTSTGEFASVIGNGGSTYYDLAASGYPQGAWTFYVRAKDSAGVWGPFSAVSGTSYLDKTNPTIGSLDGTAIYNTGGAKRRWAYNVSDDYVGISRVGVYWRLNGGGWNGEYNAIQSGSHWYYDVPDAGNGNYDVDFRAYDNSGNIYGPVTTHHTIDTVGPTIGSVDGYGYTNLTSGTRRMWAYNVGDGTSGVDHVYIWFIWPGGGWQGPAACSQSGSNWYYDVPLNATQGQWQVDFRAYDKAGNVSNGDSPVTTYFFIDSVKANDPNPNVVYNTVSATITWNAFTDPNPSSGRSSTDLYFGEWNGSAYVGTPLYSGGNIGNVTSITINGLTPGKMYRYTVTYHDSSGNESSYTYKVFITKKKLGEYRLKIAAGIIVLPVYDPASGVLGSKALRCQTAAGIACFELVATSDPNASPLRIQTSAGIRSISK